MSAKKTEGDATAPKTGLGETYPEICALTQALADKLLGLVGKAAKGKEVEILNAAAAYGTAERRRKKLARKVDGSAKRTTAEGE